VSTSSVHANMSVECLGRFLKAFTTVEPTIFNVCEYWFNKDQNRIRDLRIDTLSQMINLCNIRPGNRYLAVDDASGLVVSAVLERLGGMSLCEGNVHK
jgi:tRNA (adenine-N(1)-)-methyltransferase non-catalytic subunit